MIDSDRLVGRSAYELLQAGSRGLIGLDQRWMHALVDDPAKTLPDIVRFAGEDRSDDRVNLAQDLVAIFEYLKTPLGVPYLVEVVRRDPTDIADEVVEALAAIGQPAVDPLLKLYGEVDPDKRGEVAFLLAGLGVKDPRTLEQLLARLDENLPDGLFHLEVYADLAAIPALEERLSRTTDDDQKLELNDTIRTLRETKQGTTPVELNIWEMYPAEDSPEFDVLDEDERLEFLSHGNASQRAGAAASFLSEDELSIEAKAKLLEAARQDPDDEVRATCWACFYNATDDPEMRKTLMDRLRDAATPPVERAGVALGLVFHTDQAVVYQSILEAAEDPATRVRALEAMWRSFNPEFGSEASKYLHDPDQDVRRQAIWMVGYLQVKDQAEALPKFFEDEALREDALHNYACVYPGALARARTLDLFKKIEEEAGGLNAAEVEWVKAGLDLRLVRGGAKPFFDKGALDAEAPVAAGEKVGRNDPCPCGSGKKFKKCCGQ